MLGVAEEAGSPRPPPSFGVVPRPPSPPSEGAAVADDADDAASGVAPRPPRPNAGLEVAGRPPIGAPNAGGLETDVPPSIELPSGVAAPKLTPGVPAWLAEGRPNEGLGKPPLRGVPKPVPAIILILS